MKAGRVLKAVARISPLDDDAEDARGKCSRMYDLHLDSYLFHHTVG